MSKKRILSAIAAVSILSAVFSGIYITAGAEDKIYNFSTLTESKYNVKNGDISVFNGGLTLSTVSSDNAVANAETYTVNTPLGTESITSGLLGKGLAVSLTLGAGETVVEYYRGSDSSGSPKDVSIKIADSAGNIVSTESNTEKNEKKPYYISYTSEQGGTYKIYDASGTTNRTIVYAVIVTSHSDFAPGLGAAPTAVPSQTSDPSVTMTPKPTVDPNAEMNVQITKSVGWLESAYVEWTNISAVDKYNVYIKTEGGEYVKIDDGLIRYYGDCYRADALGLKAGTYKMKIAPVIDGTEKDAAETSDIIVKAQKREGFAFDSTSANYNPDGVGGYKNDGTVKDGAKVLYITDKNKDTVKFDVVTDTSRGTVTECTGLADILSKREKNNAETTPLIIRLIGKVTSPSGKNSSGYLQLKATSNVTVEGVGDDTVCYGWSWLVRETRNCEIKNLAVMEFYDDGISLDTNNYNDWVHNCDIFYGQNRGGDQKKGDGSLDVKKNSDYCTFSYNHFWDSGKSSLCGMTDDSYKGYHMTYHHNWFDHSDSRHPRVRGDQVHIYNNFYDGNSKYGAGACTGSSVFLEANYFRHCAHPVLISMQGTDVAPPNEGTFSSEDGGMIKMFGNLMTENCGTVIDVKENATEFDAYIAQTREEIVPDIYKAKKGGSVYSNFDTAQTMYSYTPDEALNVPAEVETYAGRIEGGDFTYEFNDAEDDASFDRNTVLSDKLVNYTTTLIIEYADGGDYPAVGYVPTPAPTVTPSQTPAPTATPTPSPSPSVNPEMCFKIIATYDDNEILTKIETELVNIAEASPSVNGKVRIMYWYDLNSMKPVK